MAVGSSLIRSFLPHFRIALAVNASYHPNGVAGYDMDHKIRKSAKHRPAIVLPHDLILKRVFRDRRDHPA
jgi:hypothetical protein